jgi:hypothetical protein
MVNRICVLILAALVAGCGGSAVTAPLARPASPASASAKTVQVQFSIVIPRRTSGSVRSPRYISASTQSASITVAPSGGSAGTPVVVNCTTACSGQIAAPVGSDSFTINLFDAINGGGNLLSTGSLTQTIVLDQANTVNATFNGVVASLSVSLSPNSVPPGTAATVTVNVAALDADNNTIVGPGSYVNAAGTPLTVTLADSDTSGATHLSATTLTGPPVTPITLSYTGGAIANPTITASASSLPNGAATLTIAAPVAGEIYVSNSATNSILVFAPSPNGTLNEAPIATIAGSNTGLQDPQDIAVDASGRIYVTNDLPQSANVGDLTPGGYITVYAANPHGTLNEAPLATVTLAVGNINVPGPFVVQGFPFGIAIDASGKMYVAGGNFATGAADGNVAVYAANPSGTFSATPLGTVDALSANGAFSSDFAGVAVDATTKIYAATPLGLGTATQSITVWSNPIGLGIDSAPPLATIAGTSTGLNEPYGVALDASGRIYAANFGATPMPGLPLLPSITMYGANPSGTLNETPLGTIFGSNTGLNGPTSVAVDSSGLIYVANSGYLDSNTELNTGGNSITVYAANPNGTLNEAPIATITGSNTGLSLASSPIFANGTLGIAVH